MLGARSASCYLDAMPSSFPGVYLKVDALVNYKSCVRSVAIARHNRERMHDYTRACVDRAHARTPWLNVTRACAAEYRARRRVFWKLREL